MRFIGKHRDLYVDNFYYSFIIKGDGEEFQERERRLLNINMMEVANKRVITVDREEDIENIAAILGNKQTKKVPVEKKACWQASSAGACHPPCLLVAAITLIIENPPGGFSFIFPAFSTSLAHGDVLL
jgi:hypothetical protein